ncbi:uncharacterized protein LOC107046296 [Diachasma alloeum]|uniref:uncharacterized protein LOC107046296 n=1 Tax=Diachasma alloeum TaxID=454923 RepID=UPI0007382B73|nr:uncharacterized protein LOC107046296 [Diachasma alloeum]
MSIIRVGSGGSIVEHRKGGKWMDEETRINKANVNKAWKKFKQNKSSNDKESDLKLLNDYIDSKKNCKKLMGVKKKLCFENIRSRIANVKNMGEFWLTVKEVGRKYSGGNDVSREKWEEFYRNMYPPRARCSLLLMDVRHQELDAVISLAELESALKTSKNNTAPGPDLVSSEFWKALPDAGKMEVLSLLNEVFEREVVPESWPSAALTML